jgi:tetratricopeptide (TPR) repeat protein
MPESTAIIHLTRAYGLIEAVQEATESLRERAIAYDNADDSGRPFLSSMVNTYKGSRSLHQQKASLVSDLNLAEQEVARAAAIDPRAFLEIEQIQQGEAHFRCLIALLRGQMEVIWGDSSEAVRHLQGSRGYLDTATAHYWLGRIYGSNYHPAEALSHFEQCLALEPTGEYSISALREANSLRSYKKKFRGSWLLLLLMFVIFFPAAILYFIVKRK